MAANVVFLQASTDDAPKNLGSYKPGNTDVIRTMLREQQKECQALHANGLFREFRGEGQKQRKFGKGYVVQQEGNLPMFDDFQAEGQTRMFELIKQTAVKEEKPLRGVWASFGKPYVCLGEPSEPSNQLPSLNRDEIANQDGLKSGARGKGKGRANGGATSPGPQSPGPQQGASQSGQAEKPPGTANSEKRAASRGRRIGTATSQKSMEGTMRPEEIEEFRLNKIKNVMRFTNNDRLETVFPQGPLKMAAHRRMKSQAKPGSFVNEAEAEAEFSDPTLAFGQLPQPKRSLQPIKLKKRQEEDGGRSTVFVTQGANTSLAAGGADDEGMGMTAATGRGNRQSYSGQFADRYRQSMPGSAQESHAGGGEEEQGLVGTGRGPDFKPIVQPSQPMRGDEDNPVYNWHNNFIAVRQAGRAQLQEALFERAEGRHRARSVGPMAANLSSILMADLDLVQGRQVPYASLGVNPHSPYLKMDASWVALQERAKVRARQAQQLDPEELRVLQRFYDQLCALVEAQRMSDPLSLMVVHKVKSLLESGTFLQRPMLVAVLDHLSKFVKGCGVAKYNKYILSVLTFISKCVGVQEAEFEDLVQEANLSLVVYNLPVPPSKMPVVGAQAQGAPQTPPEEAAAAPAGRGRMRAAGSRSHGAARTPKQTAGSTAGGAGAGDSTPSGGAGAQAEGGSDAEGAGGVPNLKPLQASEVLSAKLTPRDTAETLLSAAVGSLMF